MIIELIEMVELEAVGDRNCNEIPLRWVCNDVFGVVVSFGRCGIYVVLFGDLYHGTASFYSIFLVLPKIQKFKGIFLNAKYLFSRIS